MTHPLKPFKSIFDPAKPRRGTVFVLGTALIIAGFSLMGPSSKADESGGISDPPLLAECADLPAASHLYNKLRDRHIKMAQRELNLTRSREALDKKSAELARQIEELRTLRAEVDRRLNDWSQKSDASHQAQITNLVGVMSEVPSAGAARILLELDESLAVDVLRNCEKSRAGEILSSLPPNRAAAYATALAKVKP